METVLRFFAFPLALCGVALFVVASAAAVPKPPPKYWSPARCERAMEDRPLAPPGQVVCVGTGGPQRCRWTSGKRARLYSEFTVFMRHGYAYVEGLGGHNGVVRSFTLATRARPGFHRIVSHWGDQYVGSRHPAVGSEFERTERLVAVLATNATPAEFRSIVAPISARLGRQENATGCMGR